SLQEHLGRLIQLREKPASAIALRWTFTPTRFLRVLLASLQRKARPHLPHLNRKPERALRVRRISFQLRRNRRVNRPAGLRNKQGFSTFSLAPLEPRRLAGNLALAANSL